jgi:hypothetical protein
MKMFERPIPGQSLTVEPKSQAYERPPEVTDAVEALDMHMDNLMEEGAMEDALHFLDYGLDMVTLVQGILRSAVMEGIHSIDVSLIIAPALHEFIKGFADEAGIDYDEGFENQNEKKALAYRRNVQAAKKLLDKAEPEKPEPISMEMTEEQPDMVEEEPTEEPAKTGLMARV